MRVLRILIYIAAMFIGGNITATNVKPGCNGDWIYVEGMGDVCLGERE